MLCCLCDKEFEGHGHDAQPLAEGKCCDECVHDVNVARIQERSGRKEYLPRVIERISKERGILNNGETRI